MVVVVVAVVVVAAVDAVVDAVVVVVVVVVGRLSARTSVIAGLPGTARLCPFRSLYAVFRVGTLKLRPSGRSCARHAEVAHVIEKLCASSSSCARHLQVARVS